VARAAKSSPKGRYLLKRVRISEVEEIVRNRIAHEPGAEMGAGETSSLRGD
jgi:hypothetical protein